MIIDNTYDKFQSKFIRNFARLEIIRLLFIDCGKWPDDCTACRFGIPMGKKHASSPGKKRECLQGLPKPKSKQARDCQGFIGWNPIRVIREQKGRSRRYLADKLERHIKTVTIYELNLRIPGMATLEMYARGLSIPASYLFELYLQGNLKSRKRISK